MTYFKINGIDYSKYVNQLKVINVHNYNAQLNAAGDTVVDYINKKRTIEVGFIPLTDAAMTELQQDISGFNCLISYRDPHTNALVENMNCILPESEIEYYTIQVNKVMYNTFTLTFTEL